MEIRVIRKQESSELYHHGVKGMKWGVRRYQNKDGTLTAAGKKRLSKELVRDYKQNKSNSQPYKVSDAYKRKLKSEIKKVITDDDKQRIRASKDKWYDSLKESDKADRELGKLTKKYAKEYYDDEMRKNGQHYNNPRMREKLKEYSTFEYGYDKARRERPDLVKLYDKPDQLWKEYSEECRKVTDKILGKYGNTKLYKDRYGDLTIRKTVGNIVNSMDSNNWEDG